MNISPQARGGVITFSGTGTAGTANTISAFEAAIGGANNGAVASPQGSGFRVINWDGVALDGTDFGGATKTIDLNHTVGIPINRFQTRGVSFEEVYAVSGDGFTSVNPNAAGLFPAFSTPKTFAMFNDNSIDLSFVVPSDANTPPVQGVTRGFGAVFLNVELPNTTSIEYFNGNTSLGKFFAPVGGHGQASFLGELFDTAQVTRVELILGTDTLFSFNGTTFSSSSVDDPGHQHNLVVTDDFIYAEVAAAPGTTPVGAPLPAAMWAALVGLIPTVAIARRLQRQSADA